jgi:hypothetical protein
MKNYIANGKFPRQAPQSVLTSSADSGSWDTSKAHVRRTLEKCIELGRKYRVENPDRNDKFEAYRLLGSAVRIYWILESVPSLIGPQLHTLEDYPAHSNFCELCLVSMGFSQVFTHVGDAVRIQAPRGRWVSPVVTGRLSLISNRTF